MLIVNCIFYNTLHSLNLNLSFYNAAMKLSSDYETFLYSASAPNFKTICPISIREKFNTKEEKEAIEQIYPQCTNISIDFGIMEKADNVYIIPSSFGWSDLGTWNSAWDNMERDYLGNAVAGKNVMIMDATKCMVHAENGKLVLLQGLDDFIVVDTKDALLICRKDKEQEIKEFVAEVKRNKGDKYL